MGSDAPRVYTEVEFHFRHCSIFINLKIQYCQSYYTMGTFENTPEDACFICCKSLEVVGAASYTNHHVLEFTKMTMVNFLRKALSSCLQKYQNGQWYLKLCLECDNVIKDLDHLLHQYTEIQAQLRIVYTEAHSHLYTERNSECLEDTAESEKSSHGKYHDAESKFLQKLSDRCSSKRTIKCNPRYADVPQSNGCYSNHNVCSLCNQEHLTKGALEAHMEGVHSQKKPKRSRGRPRKHDKKQNECGTGDALILNKKEHDKLEGAQGCSGVSVTRCLDTESSSLECVSQDMLVGGVDIDKSKSVTTRQKVSLIIMDNKNEESDSGAGAVLDNNTEDKPSDCTNIDKTNTLVKNTYSHFKGKMKHTKSSEKKYMRQEKCPKCGKVVIGRMKLRRHLLVHSASREQKMCEVCGRLLQNATAYKVHLQRLHAQVSKSPTPDKKQKSCHICGKMYRGASGLSYHLAAKHNEGPRYPCDKCTRVFPHARNFSSHKAQAHGSYSMICEFCGETFKLQTQLNSHVNSVHRGITSWMCSLCPTKFSSHIAYKVHVNKHKRLTYKCDDCGKQYSAREALKKHRRTKHECYPSSMSYDNTVVTPSIISGNTSLFVEGRHSAPGLSEENAKLSVEKVEAKCVSSSGRLLVKPENVDKSIHTEAALEPGQLHASHKAMDSGSLLMSTANLRITEKEIRSDIPNCDSPDKVMNTNPVSMSVMAGDCDSNYERVVTNNLSLIISDKERQMEERITSQEGVAKTCEAIFPCAEQKAITRGHVEEVVIVETDANVNYDYIVYHVSN
nr:zinc finger protein 658-like isoform X2 [Procambarus clarkii]